MRIGNPLPTNLPQESRKAAKIFKGFVGTSNGLDGLIPTQVLRSAHGFAIFTVVKAGFLMSVRAGTGIVIARLSSGEWSAPSAIGTGGMGFGGQAGAEVTEFILVLNSKAAIRQFMSAGSITLGGNMSVALGPIGRNAEGSGALNTKGKLAAMYSYSKTKGAFAGISIEGSAIFERQDCNVKAYGSNVTSTALLSGQIDQPDFAMDLIQTLTSKAGGMTEYVDRNPRSSSDEFDRDFSHDPESNASWRESGRDSVTRNFESPPPSRGTYEFGDSNPFATAGKREEKSNMLKKRKAMAVYDFKPTEEGDLGFQKGDMIKIESKIDDDWWTGSIGMRKGIFPRNRVEPL
ncbi:hypothetical protein DFH28DRAFT_900373 [Melampsora americana]|nr:hypothetical protein DFH28DRAFT_900373 [Melampsora americana]